MKEKTGIEYLNRIYKELIHQEEVKRVGHGGNKNEDLNLYFKRLKQLEELAIKTNQIDILKHLYFMKYIIKKENIPQSYYTNIIKNVGHNLTKEEINKETENIINAQKSSLEIWIDYFIKTKKYPTWFKYLIFKGITNIGTIIKDENGYFESTTRRLKNTTNPYIELNEDAIELLYNALIEVLEKKELENNTLKQLINNGNFSKIYIHCLNIILKENLKNQQGIWKKYEMKSDPKKLYKDIYGKGTIWCTALSYTICKFHINGGDFYVYYTKDKNEKFTVPRIAIRMIGTDYVEEARGIASNQNLEGCMIEILNNKLKELQPKKTNKTYDDIKTLNYIYNKHQNKEKLTKEELMFIYEIKRKIRVVGYNQDERVKQIIKSRNKIDDYNLIYNEEKFEGNITLNELENADNLKLPKYVKGNVNLENIKQANNIIFPQIITGCLYLNNIEQIENSILPKKVKKIIIESKTIKNINLSNVEVDDIIIPNIKTDEGVKLPKHINNSIDLNSVEEINELILQEKLQGNINLETLKKYNNLKLPKILKGDLNLKNIESIDTLELPNEIHGILKLHSVKSINKKLPNILGGIILNNATNITLEFPEYVKSDIQIPKVTTANYLKLPKIVEGNIFLSSLKNLDNVILSDKVNGYLNLSYLDNATGKLPSYVGKDIFLNNLKKANKLILPETVEGTIYMDNLEDTEELIIPDNLNCKIICRKYNNSLQELRKSKQKKIIPK